MMQPSHAASAMPIDSAPRGSALSAGLARRLPAIAVCAVCTGVLLIASLLRADPSGMGTHQQLGLPACGLKTTVGLPCATCGYTTAFTHAAAGELLLAWKTQPAGAFFAVCTAAAALLTGWASFTGASIGPIARWVWRPRILILLGAIVLAAWVYKILTVVV